METLIRLYSEIQAFSQDDIISKIPANVLADIKSVNPHPFFQIYSVAHEGTSIPKILGEGAKPITWTKKAIQSISSVIKSGLKFFQGHNKTNDIITQKEVGNVIHAFQDEIKGKLHQLVIGYFPNKDEVIDNDVCSQEATWGLIEQAGQLFADTCKNITGIALENSKFAQPAFAEAKRLGMVQAFGEEIIKDSSGNEQPGKGSHKMTFQEIMQATKDMNIFPSQLYSTEELKNDREFGKYFDSLEALGKEKADLETKLKTLADETNGLKRTNDLNTAKVRISNQITIKNLPEKIKLFIEKSFDEEKENFDDLSNEGLATYIDRETKIYQRVAGALGEENIDVNSGDDKAGKDEDFSDPKQNEFLDDD